MLQSGEKLGAFIVPTGIGASVGGYAGDASVWARKFARYSKLIVNPNVVNAGGFSGITDNMFYVEGYTLDSFFKEELSLKPSFDNKIGVVFDKAIPQDVLNVHINTINAVKTVYGVDVIGYELTDKEVGVEFFMTENGTSVGEVKNIETLKSTAQNLIDKGADAIAIVCMFDDPEDDDYANGIGTDPVGGVEAILSHYISKELKVPCAHSPAFEDYSISSEIVNPKASSEYITPTFLPCILLGLANAPMIICEFNSSVDDSPRSCSSLCSHNSDLALEGWGESPKNLFTINNLDYLVMPYNALGSTPVFEAIKRDIPIFAVKENSTVLDVTNENLHKSDKITVVENYEKCLELIIKS